METSSSTNKKEITPRLIYRKLIVLAALTLALSLLLIIPSISFVCLKKIWVYIILAVSALMMGLNCMSLKKTSIRSILYDMTDYIVIFQIALLLVVLLFSYIAYPIKVNQTSMLPTLNNGQSLIALPTQTHEIERFDIVVARIDSEINDLDDTGVANGTYIIKRVIGLPGDTISYTSMGLYINGSYVNEDYILDGIIGRWYTGTVPTGCYFLMGDNRNVSIDSRVLGAFTQDQIIGIARYKVGLFYVKGIE